jgi:hypothetical protein
MQSVHHQFSKEHVDKFLLPYTKLNMEVLNTYYGKGLTSCDAHGIQGWKKIEYKYRGLLRGNRFIQWLYFKVLGRTYSGHGQKFN